jgi:hypothetical protein
MSPSSDPTVGAVVDKKLPESLDWYRDIFKWFVAIASGLLAFTVTLAKDHPTDRLWVKWAVFLLFLLIGAAGASSAWACVWIVDYANQREIAHGKSGDELDEANAGLKATEGKLRHLYQSSLWLFLAALCAIAVLFGIITILEKPANLEHDAAHWRKAQPCREKVTSATSQPPQDGKTSLLFLTEMGPFPSGLAVLKEGCELRPGLIARLEELAPRLNYLLLVGSVDQRRIRNNGSNRRLAAARSQWVGDCLQRNVPLGDLKIVSLINAPTNLGTRDERLLAEDRMVQIYANFRSR